MSELIGQSVGNYQLTNLLGKGGMGEVYRARHPMLGREVAVKVISAEFSTSTEAVARFRLEAQIVNQVGHPAIVEITDFGRLPDGRSYYVMPLLRGSSLRDHMEQRGAMTVAETLFVALPVLEALAAVHRASIVHRDIKPDNVFLDESPSGVVQPRLLDFGVAKLADPARASVGLTKTGQPIGTPLYMSPEQAMGNQPEVGAWSDVYAFGVMLYHMLSGEPPYDGPSFMSVAMKHLDAPIPSVRTLRPEVPPALDQVIQRCMQKAPAARFADAAALRQALADLGPASAPTIAVAAPVITAVPPAGTLSPPGRTGLEPAAAALAESTLRGPPASGPPRSRRLFLLSVGGGALLAALVVLGFWLVNRSRPAPPPHRAPAAERRDAGVEAPRPPAEMVHVPAGCFLRGSTKGDPDEVPVSQVCVGAFELDRLEATVNDYARCVSAGSCQVPTGYGDGKVGDDEWKWQCNWEAPGRASHPINCITYFQAQAYCTWRGKRLPTEAEWEFAARGSDGREYPWGNEPPTCSRCIMDEGDEGCGTKATFPVGSRPQGAGPFGALDQAGSVWEWVEDCWEMGFYARSVGARDPVNRCDGGKSRVIRGGSWANRKIAGLRAARRGNYKPVSRAQTIGVRCARRTSP